MPKPLYQSLVLAILYFLLLGYCHYEFVGKLFDYMKFNSELDLLKVFVSIISIVLIYIVSYSNRLKYTYLQLVYCLLLIPSLVLFAFGGGGYDFYLTTMMACLLMLMASKLFRPKVIVSHQINTIVLSRLLLLMIALYLLGIIAQGGLSYLNFNLSKVYEIRDEANSSLHPVFAYLSPIVGKIFIPLVIVMSVIQKQYLYAALGVASSIMVFGLTAHKSPLIYPILILAVYTIPKRMIARLLAVGAISLVAISILDFTLKQELDSPLLGWFGSLISRRAILIPSHLNMLYLEFFSNNLHYYWADSRLSFGLIESPYPVTAAFLMGQEIFSDPELSANTGWIGSGYANAGLLGVAFYSLLVGVIISYFSSLGERCGERFIFSATFILMITIILSADLTTVILTHGLVAFLLITMLIKRNAFH
ncbi:hypothetical protein CWC31_06765 [Pseudoalteromonas ruthenica]|uniref:hypothetical protein n=1 Tax=Pseudoalteromonas ruthenica TaxID=151081 RepID=UPI0011082C3E|nr:hypothetical protein [Pseudoalteromonas ruthenica]TLX51312.1 hypothetical protein CWC31_06765 [Pseudoalteromonas ruthenica]